jgi:chemotaxis signal transduction protein
MKAERLPFLLFQMGPQYYALAIDGVVEVAAMVELVQTPGINAEFIGIANRHGAVLPMLDLPVIFRLPPTKIDMSTLFIVVQAADRRAGAGGGCHSSDRIHPAGTAQPQPGPGPVY